MISSFHTPLVSSPSKFDSKALRPVGPPPTVPATLSVRLRYWKDRLADLANPVVPPRTQTRAGQLPAETATRQFELPPGLREKLRGLAQAERVATPLLYTAAYQTLLYRYTRQTDVCIGVPIGIRISATGWERERSSGNRGVLRSDLSGEPSFRDLLQRVHADVIAMRQHEVPLGTILQELRRPAVAEDAALYRTCFVYVDVASPESTQSGSQSSMVRKESAPIKPDITLALVQHPDFAELVVDYASDVYDVESIGRIAGHYLTVLESIVADPKQSISRLSILPAAERRLILETWNATQVDLPHEKCLHTLIEEQVERTLDAVAFEYADQPLTYRDWNRRANQLARYLRGQGVGPGIPVALCLERSLDLPIAMLAVVKAGGCYAPFDPGHPVDRLAYTIADTQAPIVLTQESLVERLPVTGVKVVAVDGHASAWETASTENLPCITSSDDPFVVIYTSGSTGRPKGVALPHRGMVSLIHAKWETPRIAADDVCLALTTCSFDAHMLDFWWPPAVGAKVVIGSRQQAMDGPGIAAAIERTKATAMTATPATWRLLLEADWQGSARLKAFSGGEGISPEMARQMLARVRGFWNEYGPAEATVFVTQHRITDPSKSPPVGRPISNAQVYVLDPNLEPVPIGCPGEIVIGGAGVGLGYLHRPELTADRFVANPFMKDSAARLYRTGDLGRFLPDGTLECLGRADFQVKIRGYRIELGEIEAVLERHPAVRQAVVVARKNAVGLDTLYAYFLPRSVPAPSPATLRKFLLDQLPDYMVPPTFTALSAFPLSPNGKIERKQLPEPNPETDAAALREYTPPINDAERALQPLWEAVFGIRPIGVTDHFQDLGGHSLTAAVLMAKIETELGHRIPLEALFATPTIRGLAERLQSQLELGEGGVLVPLQKTGDATPLFLIAGAGGHVFAFHHFARLLGSEYTVYGMKAVGVDGTEPPLVSIPEIAARYCAEIVKTCPEEGCVVGGYSVGGIIAYELALQLQRAGKKVHRLIIFDMPAPGYPKPLPIHQRIYAHCRNLLGLSWRQRWSYLRDRLRRRLGIASAETETIVGMDIVPQERLRQVWNGLVQAERAYWPQEVFQGEIVLIAGAAPIERIGYSSDDRSQGWSRWSHRPVKRYETAAPHMELFREQYLDGLTAQVREVMEAARRETASTTYILKGENCFAVPSAAT